MLIGIAKWLGTLAPTIQQGIVQGSNISNIIILMTGLLCSVWDIAYIVLLKKKMNEEKAIPSGQRIAGKCCETPLSQAGSAMSIITGS